MHEFFEVFGASRRRVATYEEPVKRLGNRRGFVDLFWKGVLLVEQKSAGHDLNLAKEQALDYFPELKDYELPRYILVSDFQQFELYDLDLGTEVRFPLRLLRENVEHFAFIMGVEKRTFREEDKVNIRASELMGLCTTRSKPPATKATILNASLCVCCFASSQTIPGSSSAAAWPRYGTCTLSIPLRALNISPNK